MTTSAFISKLKNFEGDRNHFYLDTEGNVTIGVGIMFPSADAVIKAGIHFTRKADNKAATDAEIRDDFHAVKKSGRLSMRGYDNVAKLKADSSDLDTLFANRLQEATKRAERYYDNGEKIDKAAYPTFSTLPEDIRFALIDMSFNLGNKIMKYHKLRKHLQKGEWSEASDQSRRFNVQAARNSEIAKWIGWNIEVKY
ncbi:MAG TPA: hypothetical protein PLA68_12795 [Panacibacter sp.]|nr:hypothetical protein [Panacibacter sp.]